jgi:uncharacterized LabA/DUF88 family protein
MDLDVKRIDFPKLLELIVAGRPISNIYYCDAAFVVRSSLKTVQVQCDREKIQHQTGWFNAVRSIPNINFKLYDRDKAHKVKGDDIHLAVEMVKEAYENTNDIAILITGDGDFQRAIEVVIGRGKRVENYYFDKSRSPHLNFLRGISINALITQCTLEIWPKGKNPHKLHSQQPQSPLHPLIY